MKKYLLVLIVFFISCSHQALDLNKEVKSLYVKDSPISCDSNGQISKIDMTECLGKIYLFETKEDLPKVSSKLFDDIGSGDPRLPYVLTAIYKGIVTPNELTIFGSNDPVTNDNWVDSVEKLRAEIKKSKKRNSRFRLK